MQKVAYTKLTTADEKIYYNGDLFTGLVFSQYVENSYASTPFEKSHGEEEVVNGVPTNVFKEFYKNGQLCKRIQVAPGQIFSVKNYIAGEFETYYKDGKLCEKGEIVNRQLRGHYECYYEDGSPFIKAEFPPDSRVGNGICYYRSGEVCQEGDIQAWGFSNALEKRVIATPLAPDGYSNLGNTYGIPYADHYFSDKLYDYVNNDFDFAPYPRLLHNFESRNKKGELITQIRDSIKECYDKDGHKVLVESCNEELQKHGQSCKFSYGSLREIESYYNGTLDGIYLNFNYNGFVSESGYYKDGQKVGTWCYFDANGVLR
ncbi:hypothetical protein GCM10027594_00520 [Hymenobacter agri]|uniref:Toxin-antitoxin system YwqK family antitoxin n=1 Tax=Hymenobacter jeollabukensis TaxID=2025313 RepID=A0A5R8WI32_9BACT|nr:hypothetical protein [Hymenobacter jeollabukensis]TLM88501.1 hypothetical protein FDY95_24375 [Hymenobacter jeollabukensis]